MNTHYLPAWTSVAICGTPADPVNDHALEPTCPECARLIAEEDAAYLVCRERHGIPEYLERRPYDGSLRFSAYLWQHATPFSKSEAERLAAERGSCDVVKDPLKRQVQS